MRIGSKKVRNSSCHVGNCLLGLCKFQGKDDMASRDNFVVQFLWSHGLCKEFCLLDLLTTFQGKTGSSLSLRVSLQSVFLSVCLSDRQNPSQEAITTEIAKNTQGEVKDQICGSEANRIKIRYKEESFFFKLWTFHFVLVCSWLTMLWKFQVNSEHKEELLKKRYLRH